MTVENIQPEPSSNSSTVQENAITKNEPDVSEPATKPAENSFMAPHLKPLRLKLLKAFLGAIIFISAYALAVFSLYWGAAYDRVSKLKNLRMLVVIEDAPVGNVQPVIGNSIRSLVQQPQVKRLGDWHVYSGEEFAKQAQKHDNTIEEEVLARSITRSSGRLFIFNASGSIVSIYETGRDNMAMSSYVTPNVKSVEEMFLRKAASHIAPPLIQQLSESQQTALFKNDNTTALVSTQFPFVFSDHRPFTDPVLIAPTQVGLIYLIILTFIQLNFLMPINFMMGAMKLKNFHYVAVKMLVSYAGYFILSLMYSFVSLAMQVDFTVAFGKSGFLVFWMSSFLTMCAVGGMNEVFFLICFATIPPFIGAWLLFWVISNVTPTFSPLALCAHFFRYGYAMPIHASYEISKVVFFDTYKGALGRNYAILVIWNALVFVLLPFAAIFYKRRMAQKAIAERQKVVDEVQNGKIN
ncbi:hypothetical protein QA089_001323 [Meyerozyma guilliermondii]